MSIRKLAVAFALSAVMAGGAVFAQGPAAEATAAEEAAEEALEEEVEAPAPVAAPVVAAIPAPVVEAPAPAPVEAKPAAKPETKVDFYGNASYRFRGRLWNASAPEVEIKKTVKEKGEKPNDYGREVTNTVPATEFKNGEVVQLKEPKAAVDGKSFDYLNLLGWSFGAKVKVDDQLSLQFQIGNDVTAGESVSWWNNKAPQGRSYIAGADNLYVHLAYAAWNQGSFTLSGGVVPVSSNGTLDLLERSLSTGSYGDAIFQTWSTQLNNSLIGLKLSVPFVTEDVKVSAELTTSVIEPRTQSLISGIGTTGASGVDPETGVSDDVKANPTSALLILDIPIVAGDLKITPQITSVLNRNYNSKLEQGDIEFLGGLSAGYKVSSEISLSLNGAYGTVSNENSLVGAYGSNVRSGSNDLVETFSTTRDTLKYTGRSGDTTITAQTIAKAAKTSYANKYVSNGLIAGIGTTIKAGPGVIAFNVSYGNSFNGAGKYFDTTRTTYTTTGTKTWKYTEIEEVGTGIFVPVDPEDPEGEQTELFTSTPVVKDGSETIANNREAISSKEIDPKAITNKTDILFDLRYTWNVHPKFTIVPRWRTYITTYDEGSGHVKLKMENRPELILTGSF